MDECKLEEHDLHISNADGILFCLKCDYEPTEGEIWKLLADGKKRIKVLEEIARYVAEENYYELHPEKDVPMCRYCWTEKGTHEDGCVYPLAKEALQTQEEG